MFAAATRLSTARRIFVASSCSGGDPLLNYGYGCFQFQQQRSLIQRRPNARDKFYRGKPPPRNFRLELYRAAIRNTFAEAITEGDPLDLEKKKEFGTDRRKLKNFSKKYIPFYTKEGYMGSDLLVRKAPSCYEDEDDHASSTE